MSSEENKRLEENKRIALEVLDAMGKGDVPTLERLYDDNLEWWVIGTTKASGVKTKERNIKLVLSPLSFGEGHFHFQFGDVTAQGDNVWVEVTGNLKMKAGGYYANTYAFKLTIKNGKVVAGREFMDTALVDRIFGAKPPKTAS